MLLCISGQGLTTVQAPKPPVTQESPSLMTIVLHFLFFFPRVLYQAIKAPLTLFAHPFGTPISNIAKPSEDDPLDSDDEHTHIQEASTTTDAKSVEITDIITATPISCATATPNAPSEFDIDNEAWKEAWRLANHITYPLRLHIAREYLEGNIYREQLGENIVELRELEDNTWEWGIANSEGGDWHEERSDNGWVESLGGGE